MSTRNGRASSKSRIQRSRSAAWPSRRFPGSCPPARSASLGLGSHARSPRRTRTEAQPARARPKTVAAIREVGKPSRRLAPELQLVPGGDRRHLEQGTVATPRVDVGELARLVLPGDLEPTVFDPVVEPGAAEDELPQPVDE